MKILIQSFILTISFSFVSAQGINFDFQELKSYNTQTSIYENPLLKSFMDNQKPYIIYKFVNQVDTRLMTTINIMDKYTYNDANKFSIIKSEYPTPIILGKTLVNWNIEQFRLKLTD